jgi:hypothetical protein
MDTSPLDDPWIAAQVDAALSPYIGRLPAHEVAWMREQLVEVLQHDEAAVRLVRRAQTRQVDQSGEQAYGASGAKARSKAG